MRGLIGAGRGRVLKDADRLHPRTGPGLPQSNVVQLPGRFGLGSDREGSSGAASTIILGTKGVEHVAPFAGLDATTFTVASNAATIFSGLPSLYNHELPGVTREHGDSRSA